MDAPVEKSSSKLRYRDEPTIHIRIGMALRKRLKRFATHYYMSQSEFTRIALIHYLDNHVDPKGNESLVIQE
jgi:hypothetical protein